MRCAVRCQAGTASAKMASERPLRPNTSHLHLEHAPLTCWRHRNASLNDPEAGLGGCISSGKGPVVACMETWSRTWVNDTWLICVFFINNCCKKKRNVLGRNWSQTAKYGQNRMVAPSCTVWHRNFGWLWFGPYCTGKLRLVPGNNGGKSNFTAEVHRPDQHHV